MADFMKPYAPQAYAALRIIAGLMFLCHGLQKLFGLFGGSPAPPSAMIYAAGLIELLGGALIAIGLLTRWAAFICSGQMAVAFWLVHVSRQAPEKGLEAIFPILNDGELAALYCFVFLFLSAYGPGTWSADGARGRS